MKLGRIVGTVVSSRKDSGLDGFVLHLVRDLGSDMAPKAGLTVAVDAVGAGIGEVVLLTSGSSARQTEATTGKPVDAVVVAIVDSVDVDGARTYDKSVP